MRQAHSWRSQTLRPARAHRLRPDSAPRAGQDHAASEGAGNGEVLPAAAPCPHQEPRVCVVLLPVSLRLGWISGPPRLSCIETLNFITPKNTLLPNRAHPYSLGFRARAFLLGPLLNPLLEVAGTVAASWAQTVLGTGPGSVWGPLSQHYQERLCMCPTCPLLWGSWGCGRMMSFYTAHGQAPEPRPAAWREGGGAGSQACRPPVPRLSTLAGASVGGGGGVPCSP